LKWNFVAGTSTIFFLLICDTESVEQQFQALRTGLSRVVDPVLLQVCVNCTCLCLIGQLLQNSFELVILEDSLNGPFFAFLRPLSLSSCNLNVSCWCLAFR
jgi:hypothetical protein